jgi:hypothetical protein
MFIRFEVDGCQDDGWSLALMAYMGGEHLGERVMENRELNVQDANK